MGIINLTAAASEILTNTMNALKAIRERAQTSRDSSTLKEQISSLYDNVLSLKEVIIQLSQENDELRRRISDEQRAARKPEPELRQVGSCNFYFVGDSGPYCQACYDGRGKLTALSPPEQWNKGIRRRCVLCGGVFYEQPMDLRPLSGVLKRGPQGWMGS